jgi:hypothetical protein
LVPLRLLLETALVIDPETAVSLAVVVAQSVRNATADWDETSATSGAVQGEREVEEFAHAVER